MTLTEYYNFPEDVNVSLRYTSFYDVESSDFPCPSDMSYAFQRQSRGCIKMLNTSNVTNMSYMFYSCSNLITIPQINTSNVLNISYMFQGCTNLITIPALDTSNVTNMSGMFYSCSNLITIPQIDTNNVLSMDNMFNGCQNLITIPQIDTSNVTNMSYMFNGCQNLITIPQIDTSNVTNMSYMFYKYSGGDCKLKYIPPLDCNKVTNMGNYFSYSSSSNMRTVLTDVGGWINLKCKWDDSYGLKSCPNLTYESCINILNGLYDFTGNGVTPTSSQGKLKVHQNFLDKLTEEDLQIAIGKGWVVSV